MRILSEEDRDEFVDVPYSTPTSPTKSKTGQRKVSVVCVRWCLGWWKSEYVMVMVSCRCGVVWLMCVVWLWFGLV